MLYLLVICRYSIINTILDELERRAEIGERRKRKKRKERGGGREEG